MRVTSPLDDKMVAELRVGTEVLISGVIYAARDVAHRRIVDALDRGEKLPFDLKGQTIYYMGPSPARPGKVIGSAGPTTSSRMDAFTPSVIAAGIKAIIGKGSRSSTVKEVLKKYRAVYFVATGGAAALLARAIKTAETVAYDDLGPEAVIRLTVEDFSAIVANDIYGGDLFEQGKAKYRREGS